MAKRSRKHINRVIALVASLVLALGLMPVTASAAGEGPDGPGGQATGAPQAVAAAGPEAPPASPEKADDNAAGGGKAEEGGGKTGAGTSGKDSGESSGGKANAPAGGNGENAPEAAPVDDDGGNAPGAANEGGGEGKGGPAGQADNPGKAGGKEPTAPAAEDGGAAANVQAAQAAAQAGGAAAGGKAQFPAFRQSRTVGGVTVTVQADAGAFPEGAALSVDKVPSSKTEAAVAPERDKGANVAASYTFDIKVLGADGKELQPKDGKSVKVSFAAAEVADPNLDVSVYHVADGAKEAEELPVSESGSTATAKTDGFSLYTVEFTYGDLQYVLSGGESVSLADILEEVGLTGTATAVQCSDESLFSASVVNGEWTIASHKAFSTTEWMRVTLNDVVYEITVTDAVQGDWEYTVIDGEATIINYKAKGSSQEVTIPDKLGGYPVVAIGNKAFFGGDFTGVTIPDGVKSIGDQAFYSCSHLTNVTIGNGVTTIGQEAFDSCIRLTNVTIGNGVTTIGQRAFYSCNGLTEVMIPSSVTCIGEDAFCIFTATGIDIYFDGTHGRWTEIGGEQAVMQDATVHYSCGDGVYNTLDNDGELNISKKGNGTGAIDPGAFKWEAGITTVVIEVGVTSIGNSAFAGCAALKSVEIPPSVTSIGEDAFDGCAELTSVTIGSYEANPCSLASIGAHAFRNINGEEGIDIYTYKGAVGQDESTWRGNAKVTWLWAQVTGTSAPTAGGEVTVAGGTSTGAGGMIFKTGSGSECTLTATANEGYVFANWTWTENGDVRESTDNPLKFAPTADRTLTANFKRKLTATAKDQSYVYDGDIKGPGDADYDNPDDINRMVNVDGLMDGDALVSIEVDGQSDTAGSKVYPDVLVPGAAKIFNASSEDVTGQYDITYVKGDIVIEPAKATVTTGSATKVYDGKPLTNDEASIDGLANGETATVTATGSQTEVGSSKNTCTIEWGTADAKNYTVTEKLGMLTVISPDEPAYVVASGEGSAYTEGSDAPLTFTFERTIDPETAFEHFTGIEVDGKAVPQEDASGSANWTARSGSVIVSLQSNYLKTLSEGAHTITALFDDGAPATADFSVSAPAPVATHTVTFDANGHGKAPDAQTVEHGKKAKKPANPTADGWTFGGWYTDKACKEAYDFSAPVTEDITLYAKWTKKSSSGTSPKTGDPLAGAFAIALALAAASALALAASRRRRRG